MHLRLWILKDFCWPWKTSVKDVRTSVCDQPFGHQLLSRFSCREVSNYQLVDCFLLDFYKLQIAFYFIKLSQILRE